MLISLSDIVLDTLENRRREGGKWRRVECTSAEIRVYQIWVGVGAMRPMRQYDGLVYEFYYDWLESACQDLEKILEPIHLNQTCFDDDLYDYLRLNDLDEELSLDHIADCIMDFINEYEPWYDEGYVVQAGDWQWWYSFPYYYAAVA
jgi:hypothetical protein